MSEPPRTTKSGAPTPEEGAPRHSAKTTSTHGSGRPPEPKTAGEMLAMARGFLERKGLEEARLEAELLVAFSLELDRLGLFMQLERPLSPAEIDRAREALVRRGKREPVAYITGKREFYGRDFAVGPGVLIPRPETELLVDLARERWAGREGAQTSKVADLGCGSGCLAVTLALELEGAEVLAVDLSPQATQRTRENAERLGAHVEVLEGDGLECLASRGPFDLFVSNPPYVRRDSAPGLAPDVRDFEPELALFAPEDDPDHWVRRLIHESSALLRPGASLFVELGHDQGRRALEIAQAAGVVGELHQDLERVPRVLEIRAPSPGEVSVSER